MLFVCLSVNFTDSMIRGALCYNFFFFLASAVVPFDCFVIHVGIMVSSTSLVGLSSVFKPVLTLGLKCKV